MVTNCAIRIQGLTHCFGTVEALNGLSLEVPAGSIFGFLGPNGAGKTTTIHILLGLLEPSGGTVEVFGLDPHTHGAEIRSRMGVLLEHSGVYEQLTVEDNLEFFGKVWEMPSNLRNTRIQELLTQMKLWDRRKDRAGKLSKGMRQKLALARVLLHQPELVLLDEPTAGLDVISSAAIREDLMKLAAQNGTTVFMATHNMAEAQALCDQVAVIRSGELIAIGHPDQLRANAGRPCVQVFGHGFNKQTLTQLTSRPEVSRAEIRDGHITIELNPDQDAAPLITFLVGEGVQVEEVRRGQASLEEVFLTLMEEEE